MSETTSDIKSGTLNADRSLAFIAFIVITFLGFIILRDVGLKHAVLYLIGTGFGVALLHASFGFTGGWRNFIRDRDSRAVRAHILLLALASTLAIPVLAGVFPSFQASPALGPVGVSVIVGAFIFGIGMQLGGGCGSGTLFTVGGGHVRMLITLSFFIIGATLGSLHLGWWTGLPSLGKISLISELGWQSALVGQLSLLVLIFLIVSTIESRSHKSITPLIDKETFQISAQRLVHGPWPILWGVLALAIFGLLTLLIAGYPWSITFAYSLWGAKIWTAIGGDLSGWSFWSGGYPAKALGQTVLADVTSVMDFGIILGALLAATLANTFAPEGSFTTANIMTAIIGGLMLGYGARLAFGCNIGALIGGISSASVHGWVWLIFGFLGNILGTHIRALLGIDEPMGAPS